MIRPTSSSVRSLLDALENTAGTISDDLKPKIVSFLAQCWNEISGSHVTAMEAFKVERAEDLFWDPPILSFTIERHGGTVQGSSRAELHRWSIDLQEGTASCEQGGYRQLTPAAPRLDVRPIVERACEAVQLGPASASKSVKSNVIEWKGADEICIRHGDLIPDDGPKRTVAGRRKRFRKELQDRMESIGWKLVTVQRSMTFRRGR